jgi:hypothetical protein
MRETMGTLASNLVSPNHLLGNESMIHRREAMQRSQPDERENMSIEVRVAKIEAHVEHIRSDVTDLKTDFREIRADNATLRSEVKADIAALALTVEKLRGTMRTAITAVIVLQVLTIGGAASARLLGLL